MKEKSILGLLLAVYLLCSVRYYPGQWDKTLLATVEHLMVVMPFAVGLTLLLVVILQKLAGSNLCRGSALRLFLTLGICVEFIWGIYHYLATGPALTG